MLRSACLLAGLAAVAGGTWTCATVEAKVATEFPALSDLLIIGGIFLMILGVPGRRSLKRPPQADAANVEP